MLSFDAKTIPLTYSSSAIFNLFIYDYYLMNSCKQQELRFLILVSKEFLFIWRGHSTCEPLHHVKDISCVYCRSIKSRNHPTFGLAFDATLFSDWNHYEVANKRRIFGKFIDITKENIIKIDEINGHERKTTIHMLSIRWENSQQTLMNCQRIKMKISFELTANNHHRTRTKKK